MVARDTGNQLLAVADDLICSADLEGYFTDVNPAFSRALGWSEEELLRRPYLDLVHPDDREPMRAAIRRLRETGKLVDFRSRFRAKDKHFTWIEWRAALHDETIYAVGRPRPEDGSTDLESMVTRVVRQQAAEEERQRREWIEDRDKEREQLKGEVSDSERRASIGQTKAKTLQVWIAALVAMVTTIGTGAAWAIRRIEENALAGKELEERREDIDHDLADLKARIEKNERRVSQIQRVVVETQIQVSDSTTYISKKIDAALPRAADKVDVPPSVRAAAVKVDEIKRDETAADLFRSDPDPLDKGGTDGDDEAP